MPLTITLSQLVAAYAYVHVMEREGGVWFVRISPTETHAFSE